jgi:uncharacterized protein
MDKSSILSQTEHRPWPLPSGAWIMEQGWYDLLFAHWPLPVSQVRGLVPPELEIDSFNQEAWVSITPLYIRIRPRGLSPVGKFWSFPELNCRTYVRYGGLPGIYFFSLDAASLLAVSGARILYRLPYFHSKMEFRKSASAVHYKSERRVSPAVFHARYEPASPVYRAIAGTLEHWLIERYCLYTVSGRTVWRAEIHHLPWPLQKATSEIRRNTVGAAMGLPLHSAPVLLGYAERQEVLIWPLRHAGPPSASADFRA